MQVYLVVEYTEVVTRHDDQLVYMRTSVQTWNLPRVAMWW